MEKIPRLYYLDDIPTPYRLGVFRRIVEMWPGSFKIGFCAKSEPGRTFELNFSDLDIEFLLGCQWRPSRQSNPFSFKWNPGVIKSIAQFRPDVVVLSGYAHPTMIRTARWCFSEGIPYAIACETSASSTTTSGIRWWLRRRVIGWMVRNMAFGLPVGREAASYLRMLGSGEVPMYFFPNTPDTTLFQSALAEVEISGLASKIRVRHGLMPRGPVFTFMGRLISAKRPLDAIAAFRQIPPEIAATLLIVGDGPLMSMARQQAAGDPRIVFAGWLDDSVELANILAISSALVLPSSHEPWGAVVNEAMASMTCVIASKRVGAAVELIEHGADGFLLETGDVEGFLNAMLTLVRDPGRCRRMGEAAHFKANLYDAKFAAENLVAGATKATLKRR